jgi:hypothetical protein
MNCGGYLPAGCPLEQIEAGKSRGSGSVTLSNSDE